MPNIRKEFAKDLSWYGADRIKDYAEKQNMAFHSDEEMAEARVEHRKFLLDIMPGLKGPEKRIRARMLEQRTALMPGDHVATVARDRDDDDVAYDLAATRAPEPVPVKKGRSFGGKAGQKKAAATREKNRVAAEQETAKKAAPAPEPPILPGTKNSTPTVNRDDIRARVAERLAKKNSERDQE